MLLSLPQIISMLVDKNTESHVSQLPHKKYSGIRIQPQEGYLSVKQDGYDTLIMGTNNDFIRYKNTYLLDAYEATQKIFEKYNQWELRIYEALQSNDLQRIVTISWDIFKNPMLIQNNDMRLIAISDEIGIDEINNEWNHLKTHRFASISGYQAWAKEFAKQDLDPSTKPIYLHNPESAPNPSMLCGILRHKSVVMGRFIIVEYKRSFNEGDSMNLQHICEIISKHLGISQQSNEKAQMTDTFVNMLQGIDITQENIDNYYSYMGWNDSDTLRLITVKMTVPKVSQTMLMLLSSYLKECLPAMGSFIINECVTILINETGQQINDVLDAIKHSYIYAKNDTIYGISVPFKGLSRVCEFAKQSDYAIERGINDNKDERIFFFEKYSIDYIITRETVAAKLCACSPEIKMMYYYKEDDKTHLFETLTAYLFNDKNITKASQVLGIHKNTLVYRINKVSELYHLDLNDPYIKNYIYISLKVISNYEHLLEFTKYNRY